MADREWSALNQERGRLIDKQISGKLTREEQRRYEELSAMADVRIGKHSQERLEALKRPEARLGLTKEIR